MIGLFKLAGLFALTAVAEIVGCYLPWLVLKQGRSAWLLVPAALSLAAFAWLLTLHPTAAGRTYAGYGGMYIAVALVWLRVVDGVALTRWDVAGAGVALVGMPSLRCNRPPLPESIIVASRGALATANTAHLIHMYCWCRIMWSIIICCIGMY